MGFTWAEVITTGVSYIAGSQAQELQTNTDWLNDNRPCTSNNVAVDAVADATVDAADDSGYDGTNYATRDVTADSSADTGQNVSMHDGNNLAVDIGN